MKGIAVGDQHSFNHIGAPVFKRVRQFPRQTVDHQEIAHKGGNPPINDSLKQIRRLQHHVSLLRKDAMRDAPNHLQGINRTWELCTQFAHHSEFPVPSHLLSLYDSPVEITFKRIALLTKLLKVYQDHHQQWASNANKAARESW